LPTIELSKSNNRINLSKHTDGHKNFFIGVKWQEGPYDIDVTAIPCKLNANDDPILVGDGIRELMCYANKDGAGNMHLSTSCKGIDRSADNRDGKDGDGNPGGYDEFIRMWTDRMNPDFQEVPIILTIDGGPENGSRFGNVEKLLLAIHEMDDQGNPGVEVCRYRPADDITDFAAAHIGSFYQSDGNGEWMFKSYGNGISANLGVVLKIFAPHLDFGYSATA
jgi:stress response protein SCP2